MRWQRPQPRNQTLTLSEILSRNGNEDLLEWFTCQERWAKSRIYFGDIGCYRFNLLFLSRPVREAW
jgi:hypothetical protein